MDEFDQKIKDAKQTYEPKPNFVENTMEQLPTMPTKKRWSPKVWIPALAGVGAVAVVVIAFVAWPKAPAGTTPSVAQSAQSSTSASSAPAAGSDNASLDSDLSGVQSSMNQTSSDQSNADNAINDNQQQVAVPTD